ncbi:MAG: tRNA pseudouridine(38-40) synthase TruA [Hyphomonadaceae bacterium]|nr:tRNA pseudouridine(38-40) synthase TruA [Clostridia bacterium]
MRNIALKISYDGTNYHGWQRQENGITVQQVLEQTLGAILKQPITVNGCSRTDAGVHAQGFLCNFHTDARMPSDRLPYALNSLLPHDIRVHEAQDMAEAFHARFDAIGKTYRYRILNHAVGDVFTRHFTMQYVAPLSVENMQKAASHFVGQHDFKAFMAAGSVVKDTVRTVSQVSVQKAGDEIIMDITADGFLYNMVRIIAGTLIYVGNGKLAVQDMPRIIAGGNRRQAGITAQPQGLCLLEVHYLGGEANEKR